MNKNTQELLLSLASIYLSFAGVDSKFLDEERDMIVEKLNEWVPGSNHDEIEKIVIKAAKDFKNADENKIISRYVDIVNRSFEDDMKFNIIKDLVAIAYADNILHNKEIDYLRAIINELGLSNHPNLKAYLNNLNTSQKQQTKKNPSTIDINQTKEDWTVIHDITCLLFFTGTLSNNGCRDKELMIIYENLIKFKLNVDNRVYEMDKYSADEIWAIINQVNVFLFGPDGQSNVPTVGFNSSFYSLIDYCKRGELDPSNITTIVKIMFDIAMADDSLTDDHIKLFNFLVDNCKDIDPGIEVIADLVKIQIEMQEIKKDLISSGVSEEDVPITKIDPKTGKMSFELPKQNLKSESKREPSKNSAQSQLPDEIIAEVTKNKNNDLKREYLAKIQGTDEDITDLINNQAKLKYAYEHSRLLRGKKDQNENYNWRVIKS